MKILLVEDEPDLADAVQEYLLNEGYIVEYAANYHTATEKVALYEYDCLILDINLPGKGTGLDVLRQLKTHRPDTGVIIISARNALDDRIEGLNLGADDYLTKPFYLSELNARLKALLRRRQFGGSSDMTFGAISIRSEARTVLVNHIVLDLTPKEYNLLLFFMANPNRVLRRETIAEHLLGDNADQMDDFNFIYSHVKNLRKKLLDKGCADYLQAVYGIGYKFTDQL